ncbi:MAG TPA: CBS domain-containing protein [Acetobacteraceae bacterium]|nr:CBS domain-containing protein [Acetobacteraceae bacterium]
MNAADIMTPDVITVRADTPLDQIVALMLENRISGVPVMTDDSIAGIVTEGDLLRRVELGTEPRRSHLLELVTGATPLAADYVRSHGRLASEVMTENVITVEDTTPIADIARLLEARRIKRVPVLRDGKLVGIVSRANLLRALATRLQATPPPLADDRRIRAALLIELRRHKWGATVAQLDVTVEGGVVNLWGIVHSPEQKMAVRVTAENTPGVKRVEDHLEDITATAMMNPMV